MIVHKITMTPTIDRSLPVRTFESANSVLILNDVAHDTYEVVIEIDGIKQEPFSLKVEGETLQDVELEEVFNVRNIED